MAAAAVKDLTPTRGYATLAYKLNAGITARWHYPSKGIRMNSPKLWAIVATLLIAVHTARAQAPLQKGQILPSGTLSTTSAVTAVAFSPDSKVLVGASTGRIDLWDVTTGKAMTPLTGFEQTVTSLAFSADGTSLVSAGQWNDGETRVWDVAGGAVRFMVDHGSPVTAVACSPDGASFATAGTDNSIKVWNLHTGAMRGGFGQSTYPITAMQWIPNSGLLQTAGGALGGRGPGEGRDPDYTSLGEYAVWSINGEELRFSTPIPGGSPFCSFSSDGKRLAMAGSGAIKIVQAGAEKVVWNNNKLFLFNVGINAGPITESAASFDTPSKISGLGLKAVAWSSNSAVVTVATENHVAVLPTTGNAGFNALQPNLDAATKAPVISTPGCVAFSADGRFIIAGDANPAADAKHGIQIWGIVQ